MAAGLKNVCKDTCPDCGVKVTDSGQQCEICKEWYHNKCQGVSQESYQMMSANKQIHWYCSICNNGMLHSKQIMELTQENETMLTIVNTNINSILNAIKQLQENQKKIGRLVVPGLKKMPSESQYTQNTISLYILDVRFGLLDELYFGGVLNQQKFELIRSIPNIYSTDQVFQLLNEFNVMSHTQQEQFMSALDNTQQSHVANYMRNNGKKPTTDTENWPIYRESPWNRIDMNKKQLREFIDTRNGLLDELKAVDCINVKQKQAIDTELEDIESVAKLLSILSRSSMKNYKMFIECLINTRQCRAVAMLEPDNPRNSQPISDQLLMQMKTNYETLTHLIDLETGLVYELWAVDGLTLRYRDVIQSAKTHTKSIKNLLDFVIRGSQVDFNKFIACLVKTGQQFVADILLGNGVVAEVVAQSNLTIAEEELIIRAFHNIFSTTSPKHREELFRSLSQILKSLGDCQLIAMQTEHSIKLFILCRSLTGLVGLNNLYLNQKLKIMIEQLFTELLGNKKLATINNLAWSLTNYNHCAQHLFDAHGLTLNSRIYLLAQKSKKVANESSISTPQIGRLPHELVEQLLLKAAGHFLVTMKLMTSRADIHTLTTLYTVCRYWWKTLTRRQWNRKQLEQLFTRNSFQYKFDPKLVTSIIIPGSCFVVGVAEFNNKFYIASVGLNTIHVLSIAGSSYHKHGEIQVLELRDPTDIVACNETECLFISDYESRCIRRVSLPSSLSEKVGEKFISTEYEPWTLSVRAGRLLVTSRGGAAVYLYSCNDAAPIRQFEHLVQYNEQLQLEAVKVDAFDSHAVETSDGTVIVCRKHVLLSDTEHSHSRVCEVTADGQGLGLRVLKVYKGGTELIHPVYMTMDSKNHILICDKGDNKIVHLDTELKLKQVLLTERELNGHAFRMCYSEQQGLLFICHTFSSEIDVYKVSKVKTNSLEQT